MLLHGTATAWGSETKAAILSHVKGRDLPLPQSQLMRGLQGSDVAIGAGCPRDSGDMSSTRNSFGQTRRDLIPSQR